MKLVFNIISGAAGGGSFKRLKHVEPIEMKHSCFDLTDLSKPFLNVLSN